MIRIVKQRTVPNILLTTGVATNDENCRAYTADSRSYVDGPSTFDIKNNIYGHPTVKSELKVAQHNKCCYCEKDLEDEYGAVEHFRPKGGYRSTKRQKLKKPGYYWLGYAWSNLFFVCSACNSAGNKGTLFPLLDESKRAKSHNENVTKEAPLLLDPGGRKDPRKHICFEGAFPSGRTLYGKKTIEICGLDRDALNNKRKKLIDDINSRIVILDRRIHHHIDDVNKAKVFIRDSIKPNAEFSATAIDYLSNFKILLN